MLGGEENATTMQFVAYWHSEQQLTHRETHRVTSKVEEQLGEEESRELNKQTTTKTLALIWERRRCVCVCASIIDRRRNFFRQKKKEERGETQTRQRSLLTSFFLSHLEQERKKDKRCGSRATRKNDLYLN